MRRVAFYTLGCKVNQVETEQLKEEFLSRGYLLADFEDQADIYIINTCTVTHVSDRKSRAIIRRAVRRNPEALVVAVGCIAQVDAAQLAAIEGVDLVVGNRDKDNLPLIIEDYIACEHAGVQVLADPISADLKPKTVLFSQLHQRTRAFVKIQDGCQSFCTFCIVPQARGPVRSKPPEEVLEEIRQLVYLGYKEIVLTGIHTGFYGIDIPEWNLNRLIKAILDEISGDYRIRLSSIEALEMNDELLNLLAGDRRLCRHLHIPLQSGSDRILQQMGRRYDRSYYYGLVEKSARMIPGIAITADVMVGFPGETKQDFQNTYDLIEGLPMADLHVFKYSQRKRTPAAKMPNQVEETEKHTRSEILIELSRKKKNEFVKQFLGESFSLLVEQKSGKDKYTGLTDNYIEVIFPSATDLCGQIAEVELLAIDRQKVLGQLCSSHKCV